MLFWVSIKWVFKFPTLALFSKLSSVVPVKEGVCMKWLFKITIFFLIIGEVHVHCGKTWKIK